MSNTDDALNPCRVSRIVGMLIEPVEGVFVHR